METVPLDRNQLFAVIDGALPPAEQQDRAKRQQHAEWDLAVARLGDLKSTPALMGHLQHYINGERSLPELIQLDHAAGVFTPVYQLVARHEAFAG